MNLLRHCVLIVQLICFTEPLASPVLSEEPEPNVDPWFAAHAFIGMGGCLAVREGQRLEQGGRVVVFTPAKPCRAARIAYGVSGDSMRQVFDERGFNGVYSDRALWNRIGCYWGLSDRGNSPPISISRYDESDSSVEDLPIAIDGLPASAIEVGADGIRLDRTELRTLKSKVAAWVPSAFSRGKVLRAGRRYGSGGSHELVEVFFGKPFGTGTPFDSVQICRLFLHNGQVLCIDRFSRVSGQEERADTEPPNLDERNWFLLSEDTSGFLSLDAGRTWERLAVDNGFEGYLWSVSHLAKNMPRVWDFYLYQSH